MSVEWAGFFCYQAKYFTIWIWLVGLEKREAVWDAECFWLVIYWWSLLFPLLALLMSWVTDGVCWVARLTICYGLIRLIAGILNRCIQTDCSVAYAYLWKVIPCNGSALPSGDSCTGKIIIEYLNLTRLVLLATLLSITVGHILQL